MLLMVLFQDAFWALSALMSDEKYSMHGKRIKFILFLSFCYCSGHILFSLFTTCNCCMCIPWDFAVI